MSSSTTTAGRDTAVGQRSGIAGRLQWRAMAIYVFVLGEMIVFSVLSANFLTAANLGNIALNAADLALIAAGMTLVIILGGIDVAVGSVLGLLALISGTATLAGVNPWLIVVLAVVLGTAIGALHGLIVTKGMVSPIIATIGLLAVWRAVHFSLWGGSDLFAPPISLLLVERFAGIPGVAFLVLVVYGGLAYVMRFRSFGRNVYAIGNDAEAARLAGIRVTRTTIGAFALLGGLVGVAALVFMSRTGVIQAYSGQGLELAVIAAVVVGGTSITGGRGAILGTLGGVVFVAVLQNGVVLLGVPPLWNGLLLGAFILLAVSIDAIVNRRAARRERAL
jgi:ribose/xylose/arabinose/galactoside ABC-type transport system permease subunit